MNLPRAFGLLLALLSVSMAVPGCATAGQIAVACGPQEISIALADYNLIKSDVQQKNWADLAKVAGRIGYSALACVLGNLGTQEPGLKDNIEEFKTVKSVEFRAAAAQPTSWNWRAGRSALAFAPGTGPGWRGEGGG
jgi:hypothetical protein